MDNLGERLSRALEARSVSPYQLHKRTGISQSTFSRILKDQTKPNDTTISAICSELSIRKDWLVSGSGPMDQVETTTLWERPDRFKTIGERVDYARQLKGMSFGELAEEIGFKNESSIRSAVRHNSVRPVYIPKLSEVLKVNRKWLELGEGPVERNNNHRVHIDLERDGIPFYDIDFIGGYDFTLEEREHPTEYIYLPFAKGSDFACRVSGRSMAPYINDNDVLALKRLQNWREEFVLYGKVYAIIADNIRTVKILGESKKGEDYLKLIPLNKAEGYTEQDIPKSIIREVYLVIARANKVT